MQYKNRRRTFFKLSFSFHSLMTFRYYIALFSGFGNLL